MLKRIAESNHAVTVTESKIMIDSATGEAREVDVCIEGIFGGVPVIVSIECVDHARKVDVQWVEQQKSKHERLPTTSLVLASRSGFSKPAKALAEALKINVLHYQHVTDKAIRSALNIEKGGAFSTRIAVVGVVALLGDAPGTHGADFMQLERSAEFLNEDGQPFGRVDDWSQSMVADPRMMSLLQPLRDANRTAATVEIVRPRIHGQPTYVIDSLRSGDRRVVEGLRFACWFDFVPFEVDEETAYVGGTLTTWGETKVREHDAMFVQLGHRDDVAAGSNHVMVRAAPGARLGALKEPMNAGDDLFLVSGDEVEPRTPCLRCNASARRFGLEFRPAGSIATFRCLACQHEWTQDL